MSVEQTKRAFSSATSAVKAQDVRLGYSQVSSGSRGALGRAVSCVLTAAIHGGRWQCWPKILR